MFALYLLVIVWLVLFKFSFHPSSILDNHHRSLNLIPFAAPKMENGRIVFGEMVMNCLFFVPFGLLLNVNYKKVLFLPKLIFILIFSLSAEAIQYYFAIGATDISDVITNTSGGLLGLIFYYLANKFIKTETLDRFIVSVGLVLFIIFMSIHLSHLFRRSRWK
jgi:glycopeptide antibiotics resistance protein